MSKKKILILGGSGFIGNAVYNHLKKTNLVKKTSLSLGLDLKKIKKFELFLNNKNFDYIINCAAHVGNLEYIEKNGAQILTDNILINTNIYRAIRKKNKKPIIINLISNCFYPGHLKVQTEKNWQDGPMAESVSSFGISKRLLIHLSDTHFKQHKIISINLILPNAYGPGDYLDPLRSHALNGIIVRMLKSKKEKKNSFEIWGSGKPKREWIYVGDVPKAISRIIKKSFNNNITVNIAQNKSYTILNIAKIIRSQINYDCKINKNLKLKDGALIKQLDNKKFKSIFKNFHFINLKEGIKQSINYYKKII